MHVAQVWHLEFLSGVMQWTRTVWKASGWDPLVLDAGRKGFIPFVQVAPFASWFFFSYLLEGGEMSWKNLVLQTHWSVHPSMVLGTLVCASLSQCYWMSSFLSPRAHCRVKKNKTMLSQPFTFSALVGAKEGKGQVSCTTHHCLSLAFSKNWAVIGDFLRDHHGEALFILSTALCPLKWWLQSVNRLRLVTS